LQDLRNLTISALSRNLAVGSIVIVMVLASSRSLLEALWGVDNFGGENLNLAVQLLNVYYILLFATGFSLIARKMTIAMGMVSRQYLFASVVQMLSALSAWLLISTYGTYGALFAIFINTVGLALVPYLILIIWKPDLAIFYPAGLLFRWSLSIVVGLVTVSYLESVFGYEYFSGNRIMLLIHATILACIAAMSCLSCAWVLKIHEVRLSCKKIVGLLRNTS
jgi:hypothetical protein